MESENVQKKKRRYGTNKSQGINKEQNIIFLVNNIQLHVIMSGHAIPKLKITIS